MNIRIAALSGAAVTAAMVALPLATRERLPEPLAVHWGPGSVPDGTASFAVFFTAQLGIWVLMWLFALTAVTRGAGREATAPAGAAGGWALLAGGGLLALGVSGTTVLANLDAASWTGARLPAWAPVAIAVLPLAVALAAAWLGRGRPGERSPAAEPPSLRLRPGQRAVWVSRVSNPWLVALTGAAAAGLVVAGVLLLTGIATGGPLAGLVPALALVLLLGLFTSAVRARVTADGVAIGFGPLGRPVRRISLAKIDRAWSEPRHPSQVGGWGLRGVPGGSTIMLRGGDCLVIRYRSGGELAVSIDDAGRGAALINALVAERGVA
ncbi:hypothetical protein [Nonomuraea sp. SBT364]|uniref:hypothetical protein n=1 Tax=Nonomuraea sp. SBT364 TaxID=1580530 RepID=UPI00066CB6C6|nr:hypothetical protein [Nonomuraea sp. SBT364]